MNYIQTLQQSVRDADARTAAALALIVDFRAHLQSPKFGPQSDGSRGDWIATADVHARLVNISDALRGIA
jgi:hypothetical protein